MLWYRCRSGRWQSFPQRATPEYTGYVFPFAEYALEGVFPDAGTESRRFDLQLPEQVLQHCVDDGGVGVVEVSLSWDAAGCDCDGEGYNVF